MKRILSVLLLAVMLFSLCACGNDDNNEAPGKEETGLQTSAKDFIAALQQNTGAKTADKLLGTGDDDYESLLSMYLGVEPALISDGAMALSTSTTRNEIIVLRVKDAADTDTVKTALENHRNEAVMSDERYFPENAAMMKDAAIFDKEGYVILISDEFVGMIKSAVDQLFSAQDLIPGLAEEFYNSVPEEKQYDYEQPVPANEIVGSDWFSDAIFIGDSRMEGIMIYAEAGSWFTPGLKLTKVGLTVSNVYSEYVTVNGQSMTVADGIRQGGSYGKCYILLGINELGWGSSERFIECYKELVQLVKEAHPETQIYIIGNLPLGDKAVYSGSWLTNDNVIRFNGYIRQVAAEEQVYYIDAYELLQVDGRLPAEASNDGIHVQPEVSKQLVEYLMSHTVSQ